MMVVVVKGKYNGGSVLGSKNGPNLEDSGIVGGMGHLGDLRHGF